MLEKICFLSLNSYPVLTGTNLGYVGGDDVQQVLLAKELIKHNFKVTFITYDDGEGQAPVEHVNEIRIIKVYKRKQSSQLSLLSKIWHILRALAKANAEIYFHEAGTPGVVSVFCRLARKKIVRYIDSDAVVIKDVKEYKLIERFGDWLDIKLADVVIAQNEFQRAMLKENFGRDSLIIKNAFPLVDLGMPEKAKPPIVLWVGRIQDVKQPELFLLLAEAIPEGRFQMVGGAWDDTELYDRVKEASGRIPNLDLVGFVPLHEIDQYFQRASIFVNTSRLEGFPNTFIQAWLQYVPTVSLNTDPDESICRHKLGFHSRTFDQLVEDVETLLKDEQLRQEMGRNARQYVEEKHDIATVVKRYIEVFSGIEVR